MKEHGLLFTGDMIRAFLDGRKNLILKEIPGIPAIYMAGSDGNIYSFINTRQNSKREKPFPLKNCITSSGYFVVTLCIENKKSNISTHTLICRSFHGSKPGKKFCVRHLDGNKLNNIPENLCWGTYIENEADKKIHDTWCRGERQHLAKLNAKNIKTIRHLYKTNKYTFTKIGKMFGVEYTTISSIIRGRTWKHVI